MLGDSAVAGKAVAGATGRSCQTQDGAAPSTEGVLYTTLLLQNWWFGFTGGVTRLERGLLFVLNMHTSVDEGRNGSSKSRKAPA